jgi:hypothetical protein
MQREIKFRVWCPPVTDGEVTLPGHMDYQLAHQKLLAVRTETRQPPADFGFDHIQSGLYFINQDLAAYGDRLMQFTGLKDKNGKEIYEGDILQQGLVSGGVTKNVVEWQVNKFSDSVLLTSEIIGNIYENPELLKQ